MTRSDPPTATATPAAHALSPELSRSGFWTVSRVLDLLGPVIALAAIFLFFTFLIGGNFASFSNVQSICEQSTIVCVVGIGMTFIIISGGIDLSVGSAVALCAVVAATLLAVKHHDIDVASGQAVYGITKHEGIWMLNGQEIADYRDKYRPVGYVTLHPVAWPLLAVAAAAFIGVVSGVINGLLITGLRLVPFIATLGTMMIYRSLTKAGALESKVETPFDNWVVEILHSPTVPESVMHSPLRVVLQWLYLAPGTWITIALAILMIVVLRLTRFGRHVTAIGSNEQTARLCGIPVNRRKIAVYLLGGFFAGCAGVMQYSRASNADPSAATGLELSVIAAVVIGGASLNGGKGSILGTLVGALMMSVIARGCAQVPIHPSLQWLTHGQARALPTYVEEFVTGCIIIIAVALDNLRQRRPR